MNINEDLIQSIQTGFVDVSIPSVKSLRPELLSNNFHKGKKVLTSIIRELKTCDEFWISVAFITTSGVATLINTLIELEAQQVKGKILASQYLNFTQPEALRRLSQFKNIELRMSTEGAFHSKGYLFQQAGIYNLIIGSSNLTESALSTNKEWNLKISGAIGSELINQVVDEFKSEFNVAQPVTGDFINQYEEVWKKKNDFELKIEDEAIAYKPIVKPNLMQKEALENLDRLRSEGKTKALLVSATGTGKTYLSAFDVQRTEPKRFLFVVHRRLIAEEAMKTFKSVMPDDVSMGMFSGKSRELESQYMFSTIQTISKPENLKLFSPEYFEYIVIDETHRAGADSYIRILNHFEPKFLLGMTATPERTDGGDIYKMFNYNIAYEIRLHRALEENMLSSFHYYGVSDLTINNEVVDDVADFNKLTSSERVNRICEAANKYGCDNGKVRGLVFCSRTEIAEALSKEFNTRGYKTIALTGKSSEEERQSAIDKLENEDDKIDYIFTVDIFNEGIDIPKVNQIIMLRPTQSAIIFVQQLGRGLRKAKGKEYLTVIDFIGNYSNNYLIPIALYGDTSYNKDTLRKLIASESSWIPGSSTVNFDKITKERIFTAINNASMQTKQELVHDYNILKMSLGRIPMMMDFVEHGSRDPFLYVKKYKSYYNFVSSIEPENMHSVAPKSLKLLELFGQEINNTKRVEESYLLSLLMNKETVSVEEFKQEIEAKFNYSVPDTVIESCLINLNFNFIRQSYNVVALKDGSFHRGQDLASMLSNSIATQYLLDNTAYSIQEFKKNYDFNLFRNGLILNQKYSRKDVCRLLNWPLDISSTLYGYRTNEETTPCFITYHKSDDISEGTMYNDHFIDQQTFAWESRSNRKVDSPEIRKVIDSKRILLFVKKEDGEGTDFYYLGDVSIIDGSVNQSKMNKSGQDVVRFTFKLEQAVEESLYSYLIG